MSWSIQIKSWAVALLVPNCPQRVSCVTVQGLEGKLEATTESGRGYEY